MISAPESGGSIVQRLLITALTLGFLCLAAPAPAQDLPPADQKAVHDYTLSMDKVKALQAAIAESEKTGADEGGPENGGDATNLAAMKAELQAHKQLFAILTKHGLSADDAVMIPIVLMSASAAALSPDMAKQLAGQTSAEQIAFVKAHQAELNALSLDSK
jgi:hypothetical protein